MNREAKNFERIATAKKKHDVDCPEPATGVGMSYFDIERMQWEEGDNILGLTLQAINISTGRLRILCPGLHNGTELDEDVSIPEKAVTDADAVKRKEGDLVFA